MATKKLSGDWRWFFYTPADKAGYRAFPGGQSPPRCSLIDMDYEACHQAIFVPAINKVNHNVHRFLDKRGFLYKRGPQNEQVNSFGELNSRAGDGGFFVWNWEEQWPLGPGAIPGKGYDV